MKQFIEQPNNQVFWSLIESRDRTLILANQNIIKLEKELQECLSLLEDSQSQLQETKNQLHSLQAEIRAMESSKFWRIRKYWFKLKSIFVAKKDF